jgi:hypothetical protein
VLLAVRSGVWFGGELLEASQGVAPLARTLFNPNTLQIERNCT